jgi:hypothetical protein
MSTVRRWRASGGHQIHVPVAASLVREGGHACVSACALVAACVRVYKSYMYCAALSDELLQRVEPEVKRQVWQRLAQDVTGCVDGVWNRHVRVDAELLLQDVHARLEWQPIRGDSCVLASGGPGRLG